MESLKAIIGILWEIIEGICVLYSFGTIIWLIIPKYWQQNIKGFFRRSLKKLKIKKDSSIMSSLLLDDIQIVDGPFENYGLRFTIDNTALNVPNDFIIIGERLKQENALREQKGCKPVYTELYPYAVHTMSIPREQDIIENIERPVCRITLRESSYFYSLIAIQAMDEMVGDKTIREKYYQDILDHPTIPAPNGYDVVHAFGMNTFVLTKDNSFVFGLRNPDTVATGEGSLHLSVGEHLNKDLLSSGENWKSNAIKIIIKGLEQELGVEEGKVDSTNIRFYGVALSRKVCQYGVLGFTHLIDYTDDDIKKSWEFAAKDGHYENKEIVFINATIKSIVKYLNDHKDISMTKFALLNVCIALMIEYNISQDEIDRELKKLRPNALQ